MLLLSFPLFVHFSFCPSKFSVTNFSACMRASLQILYTHWEWPSILWDRKKTQIYFALFLLFSISHSNVIHWRICDKYFAGTIACRILLFGTSVVNHLLFYVKENRFLLLILLIISFSFSQIFKYKKFHLFLRDWESHKVETWSTHGQ